TWRNGEQRRFSIERSMQIANYADFCNECGNCDTFCPEYDGPYIKKPGFYGSIESWRRAAPRDGFLIDSANGVASIRGRIQGVVDEVGFEGPARNRFSDGTIEAVLSADRHEVVGTRVLNGQSSEHKLDLWPYHTMRHLYQGVLDRSRINQVNAAFAVTS